MKIERILKYLYESYRKMRLFEERYNYDSFWITPNDEYIKIDTHHYNWVLLNPDDIENIDVLKLLELSEEEAERYGIGGYEKIPTIVAEDIENIIYPKMFEEGWIRGGYFIDTNSNIVFQTNTARLKNNKSYEIMMEVINKIFSDFDKKSLVVEIMDYKIVEFYKFYFNDFLWVESYKDLKNKSSETVK